MSRSGCIATCHQVSGGASGVPQFLAASLVGMEGQVLACLKLSFRSGRSQGKTAFGINTQGIRGSPPYSGHFRSSRIRSKLLSEIPLHSLASARNKALSASVKRLALLLFPT